MRFVLLLATGLFAASAAAVDLVIPQQSRQMVLVTTSSWTSPTATLQRLQRRTGAASWEIVGPAVPALIGERGLGWGLGRHSIPDGMAPRKVEGDRRAPAGIFRIGEAFGTVSRSRLAGLKMPYRPLTPTTEAIDDPASRNYNRIVDRMKIARPDWRSSERMATIPAYKLGLVVAHNAQRQPGAGSCIFIHLWMKGDQGTAGCTALREEDLLTLLRWLDPGQQPLLIQLPKDLARQNLAD